MLATLHKNNVQIDWGSADALMRVFADPGSEAYMYDAAMTELNFIGSFEFVKDNNVYLIKKV